MSRQIEAVLDGYRDWRDGLQEAAFHAVYRNPVLQALLGLRASDAVPRPRPGREPEELAFMQERIAELRADIGEGGLREAAIRAVLHVARAGRGADERAFAVIRKARSEQERALPLAEFKALIRDQYLMLVLDEEEALAALPRLLRGQEDLAPAAFAMVETVVTAAGPLSEAGRERLARIAALFGVGDASGVDAPGRQGSKRE
jgi:hypothetical protein